jgi:hypothetical protein
MNFKIILFLLFSSILINNTHAALFGPSNYNECVLEVSKTAKTDAAVGIGISACSDKFDKKDKTVRSSAPNKTQICYVYWDGFKLIKGKTKGDYYIRYSMPYYGVEVVELALPKPMTVEFGISNLKKDVKFDWRDYPKFKSFLESNFFPIVNGMCGL